MTKILKPRPASDASAWRGFTQADGARQPRERATGSTALKARTVLGDQEGLRATLRTKLVALLRIQHKGCMRRVLDRNEAGLSELCLPDGQNVVLKIHIGHVERQRLPGPQSGSGQQPNECRIGKGSRKNK